MNDFLHHVYVLTAGLILAAACAYLLGGFTVMLAVVNLVLLVWLARYWLQLARLVRWLEHPKLRNIPHAGGMWERIFTTLLQQAKSRKKRKQKLGRALYRFNAAAEAMPNGVLVLGKDGRLQWMNSLAAKHLRLNLKVDMNGILPNLIRTPEFHHLISRPLDGPAEMKLVMENGVRVPQVLHIVRVPFEEQADLLITQDITAAEQLNVTRTAFVANVSHELRTPLTVINGFLETLADMPDLPQAQQQQFIGLMRKEGDRMQRLLADLLTLSRLENSSSHAAKTPVCLSALVRQLLQEAQNLSRQQHTWHSDIAPDIWVNGVQMDLYSGLSNLVFNAVRYTPDGGTITVRLHSRSDAGGFQAAFSVADNGPGIAAEHLPHLTERFYRVDPGRSRQNGGTGLGLAITKHALTEHQGTLLIESEVGKGSTFTAVLPQIAAPDDAAPADAEKCKLS